jgi:hypothetical protein
MDKFFIIIMLLLSNNISPHPIPLNIYQNYYIQNITSKVDSSNRVFLPIVIIDVSDGSTFYVSPDGSDTNPGTFLLPWKTIVKASQMVRPGDTAYLREGVYFEAPRFTTSGTESYPIKIQAYPGENVIIDGKNQLPLSYRGLVSVFGDWVEISGLEIRNSMYGGLGLYGKHNTANNIFAHHSQKSGIHISGDYGVVEYSRVWRNSMQNEYGGSSSSSPGLTAARDLIDGITEHAIMGKNVVWENWGEGISTFEAIGTIIEDNISHDNLINLYISDATHILCQRNFVYTNPDSPLFNDTNTGIMLGDETYDPPSANITIINNIAYGNQGNFWWWQGVEGGGMDNVLIANNTFVNGIGDPDRGRGNVIISRGDHQDVRFENNLVQQDGELPVIATSDLPGITYSHNLWSKPPYDYVLSPNDIIADPQLSETGDPYSVEWFRPASSSPAIDHALAIPEVVDDYLQNPRRTFPDMGAIEYIPD